MSHHPSGGRRRAVAASGFVAGALATLVLLVGPAAPAGAATNGSWSIYPTTIPGQLARPYFAPILADGQRYSDSVTVTNQTANTYTFNLYAADAHNTPSGGFALSRRTDPKLGMGAWIQLPVSQVTLTPQSFEVVPFTIAVPPNATPGDHPGGIVVEATQGATQTHGSVSVTVLQAVGVRVYGRVQGKLVPSMGITHLSISPSSGFGTEVGGSAASTVTFTVANTGNIRLTSTATVTVSPLAGKAAGTKVIKVPELLPQNSETFTVKFPSVIPLGRLQAKVNLVAQGTASTGTATAVVIPWLLVLLVVLLVAGIIYWRRRRRAQRGEAAGLPPSNDDAGADLQPAGVGGGAN